MANNLLLPSKPCILIYIYIHIPDPCPGRKESQMRKLNIPGREELCLHHLILDYNGTIAEDGTIIESIRPRLAQLSESLHIYVITADTHGTAARRCEGLPLQVLTFPTTQVGEIKAAEVRKMEGGVVTIGNGFNDIQMSDAADLSICVIGREGCCGALLSHCDVVVTSIDDALDLLIKPDRLRATLRT